MSEAIVLNLTPIPFVGRVEQVLSDPEKGVEALKEAVFSLLIQKFTEGSVDGDGSTGDRLLVCDLTRLAYLFLAHLGTRITEAEWRQYVIKRVEAVLGGDDEVPFV